MLNNTTSIEYINNLHNKNNLCLKLNINKTEKYLKEEKFINLNKSIIRNIFKNICKTIYQFYLLQYLKDVFAEENTWGYYSADESLFTHIKGKQIWVLNIINTINKKYRISITLSRDTPYLKKFMFLLAII